MIPPAALAAIDTAAQDWAANPTEGPLSAAVANALSGYDVRPTRHRPPPTASRATCATCDRDWALTTTGHLRYHRVGGIACDGSGSWPDTATTETR
jgi:hypothetical protein